MTRAVLPRTPGCGSFARNLLTRQLDGRVDGRTLDDAKLVVSELANNAYLHGSGEIELSLETFSDRVRLEVSDEGTDAQLRLRDGHGLHIVDVIASAWGTRAGSTHVWAELLIRDV